VVLEAKTRIWIDMDQFDSAGFVFMEFFEPTPWSFLRINIHERKGSKNDLRISTISDEINSDY
jgi:hypothetical protein